MQPADGRASDGAHRELVGELAERLSHDLANRLAVARLTAEVLANRPDLPADLAARVATVVRATGEAGDLVQQLSAVAGRRAGPPHPVDLARLVGDLEPLLRSGLGKRPLEVDATRTVIVADRRDIEEIVLRLVLGGRKGTVDDAVTVVIDVEDDCARLTVGRPDDDHVAPEAVHRARQLVEACGGTLDDALVVRLPLALEAPVDVVAVPHVLGATVLVVEDDPDLRVLVRGALEGDGHRVADVADAGAAMAHPLVTTGELDLLVTDVELPGTSGLELAATLADRGVRVLVMSGHGEASIGADLPVGAVVLDKPFGVPDLRARTREALEG